MWAAFRLIPSALQSGSSQGTIHRELKSLFTGVAPQGCRAGSPAAPAGGAVPCWDPSAPALLQPQPFWGSGAPGKLFKAIFQFGAIASSLWLWQQDEGWM